MATSNVDRVGQAMNALQIGLRPFVIRELESVYGKYWPTKATENWQSDLTWNCDEPNLDVYALLKLMWDNWNEVFRSVLGQNERTLVSELREWRNKWAHQNAFSTDDTYRVLDSTERLLHAISAPEVEEVEKQKQELLRIRFEEQTRKETRKAAGTGIEGQPMGGLKPWREVVTPHPDVASGRYQQAEFAAHLGQVHRGAGSSEYLDPVEFFRRTYITDGLGMLLAGALRRLSRDGGDPVVELQTNFGGGKTHSMLALYHLFAGRKASELAGIEPVLQKAGVSQPFLARRAVLVGTDLSPAHTHPQPEGVVARTLWGVMASQLLGAEGYAFVAEADRRGISPGTNDLIPLFEKAAPCLILIDEWVTFVRQVYSVNDLPAGSFDANLTFAQALTEAAKAVPGVLVVASLPSSDIEVGGEGGRMALERLKNTFSRLETAWRPASAEEGFEIVRRRLFQPITDPQLFAARDAVIRAFGDLYRANPNEFPLETREAGYERRIQGAYPIHPELFDRLYQDWSSLDKFQRTRGVLRLMASVIYELWAQDDKSLLIMPATVPMSAGPVQFELTRYMEDPWVPVIEKDVDGPNALPLGIDRDVPNLGRYSAARRVARTLYMGSAPTLNAAHKGLDERHIKLGCVQAGESIPVFGDALRRLTNQANHLYEDGTRYWFSTQPSVTRMALERAHQCKDDDVLEEIKRRIRDDLKDVRQRGDFASVTVAPSSPNDVADERDARLVILGPDFPHGRGVTDSKARKEAAHLLDNRGAGQRLYRNAVVFLAPDLTRIDELKNAIREFLGWKSIEGDAETLNLDRFQSNQVKTRRQQSETTVQQQIPSAFCWLLVPEQPDLAKNEISWQELRLQGDDGLALRASKRLRHEDMLVTELAGVMLRRELDRIPLWSPDPGSLSIRLLLDYFAQYLYLPRLKNANVLRDAIADGLNLATWEQDSFAFADNYDAAKKRYQGLRAGAIVTLGSDSQGLLVKPDIAARQMEAEKPAPQPVVTESASAPPITAGHVRETAITSVVAPRTELTPSRGVTRFHGSISLDAMRLSRDAGTINQEVIQHLIALVGAQAEIRLEISVDVPGGIPEGVVRTVMENCRTLKFTSNEFENE